MKRALIFLHGSSSDPKRVLSYASSSLIICADGGLEYAVSLGITPDVIVGDLDSIDEKQLSQIDHTQTRIEKYPRDKDMTDGEIAIMYAIEQTCSDIIVTGFLGDRVDHLSANLMYIAQLSENHTIRIIEKDQDIYFVRNAIEILGSKGDEVSLIPMKDTCSGVKTQGLQYVLNEEVIPWGSTRGISNVMLQNHATVSLTKGVLMVVHRIL